MRPPLPIDEALPGLLSALRESRSAVLVAPPGSGKTTRVPPALLGSGLLDPDHPSLLLLQPRRVAARASAARIAVENGWHLGGVVGYQVRDDRRVGPETRLHVVTEGILTRRLLGDPYLEGVGAVLLDEFHERSIHSDLALAMLREVQGSVRPDLMIVVMSATLDAGPVAAFLGGCPIIEAAGRAYPVAVEYLPCPARLPVAERVEMGFRRLVDLGDDAPGDALFFLPGAEEIRRGGHRVQAEANERGWLVLPLHGSLPAAEQDRALRPADRRKIILATNVAETSLTIEGVGTVVDIGLARRASHDPARGMDRLVLGKISRASADQRAGRAGRTGPGRCIRLWSEREHRGLAPFDPPEIARVDLAGTLLAVHGWGTADFGWFEPPPEAMRAGAERLLDRLGALDERGHLSDLGRRLLAIPAHPRVGRLLLDGVACGLLAEAAALAALLSEKDILTRDFRAIPRGRSDLLVRLDALADAERLRFSTSLRDRGIDPVEARRIASARDALLKIARRLGGVASLGDVDEESILRLILAAYPDRVCRRRAGDPYAAVMVGGRGIRLDPSSVVVGAEFFLALDPHDDGRGEPRVRIASEVRPEWLAEDAARHLSRQRVVAFDADRGRAVATETTYYLDLPIRQHRDGIVSAEEASIALSEHLHAQAGDFLRSDPAAASWLDRLACLRGWRPEDGWPEPDGDDLAAIVAEACQGKKTVEEVRRVPLAPILRGWLGHERSRRLDELAPEALAVPSGGRHPLSYEPGRSPILAVRLQELFGWAETPRVGGGRIPVLLHLLGPNFRPVQVTEDLRSFWTSTYHQVRKDLRLKYPRHSWPEDPWTAKAEAKGGRRA